MPSMAYLVPSPQCHCWSGVIHAVSSHSGTRATWTADHLPCPRAVGMPWVLRPTAMARRLVAPARVRSLDEG